MKKDYWNRLFSERRLLLPPEEFLKDNYLYLHGRVLDLASGDGRNAVFLSEKGFGVLALDYSEKALEKIEAFNNPGIETILADLSRTGNFRNIRGYDSVLINHFVPRDEILLIVQDELKEGGRMILVAFSSEDEEYHLSPDYIEDLLGSMRVVKKEIFSNDWGEFNGMILEKRA